MPSMKEDTMEEEGSNHTRVIVAEDCDNIINTTGTARQHTAQVEEAHSACQIIHKLTPLMNLRWNVSQKK